MRKPDHGWYTVPEACRRLQVSRRTLLRLIDEGHLPAYRFGWLIRLRVGEVEDYRRRVLGDEE